MSAQLENVQLSATHASDLMEEEQLEKRTLQEQLTELSVRHVNQQASYLSTTKN